MINRMISHATSPPRFGWRGTTPDRLYGRPSEVSAREGGGELAGGQL
jgi:hypothetical protein